MKIFIALLLVAMAHYSTQDIVKSVAVKAEKDSSDVPENKAAKQCGGAGKLVKQHNSMCKDSTAEVCKAAIQADVIVETNFEPSKDFEKVGWRISHKEEGKEYSVDHEAEVADSKLTKGSSSFLHSVINPDTNSKGKITVKYELYDPADKDKAVDLCIEVNFDFQ